MDQGHSQKFFEGGGGWNFFLKIVKKIEEIFPSGGQFVTKFTLLAPSPFEKFPIWKFPPLTGFEPKMLVSLNFTDKISPLSISKIWSNFTWVPQTYIFPFQKIFIIFPYFHVQIHKKNHKALKLIVLWKNFPLHLLLSSCSIHSYVHKDTLPVDIFHLSPSVFESTSCIFAFHHLHIFKHV